MIGVAAVAATRRCSKCGEEKPARVEFFSLIYSASGRNRLRSWCRPCCNAYTAARQGRLRGAPNPLKRAAFRFGTARRGSVEELEARDALIVAVLEHVEKSRVA